MFKNCNAGGGRARLGADSKIDPVGTEDEQGKDKTGGGYGEVQRPFFQ